MPLLQRSHCGKEYRWYDLNVALSRNPTFFFDIGARGIGKTTAWLLWARRSWEATGERWAVVVRRRDEMTVLRESLWSDFTLGGEWETTFHSIRSLIRKKRPPDVPEREWRQSHPWQLFGVFLCLGDAIRYKQASQFFSASNINKMLFDEFIIEDDSKRYLSTEPAPLFSVASSVFRNRPRRVYCFSNAGFVDNPYFRSFGVKSSSFNKSGFYTPAPGVLFHYSDQPSPAVYSEGLPDTELAYQVSNLFRDVTGSAVAKRTPGSTPFANLSDGVKNYVCYREKYGRRVYVEEGARAGGCLVVSLDKFTIVKDGVYSREFLKELEKMHKANLLRFDCDETRIKLLSVIL